jgi:hypothetical protein
MNFSSESQKKFRLCNPAVDRQVRRAAYPVSVSRSLPDPLPGRVGLCADCQFMRQIESDRGSVFYQCQLSATDPRFPKYPRLPVLRCSGYESSEAEQQKADR